MMSPRILSVFAALLLLLVGCSSTEEGADDIGHHDDIGTGEGDAGGDEDVREDSDVELPDADPPDASIPDADPPDAELPDADPPDASIPDADPPDASSPDADLPDTGNNEGASCGGFVGDEFCEDNEFCVYERDVVGASTCLVNGVGTCTAQPSSCDDDVNPVCGCDFQTYNNECEAHSQGVDVYTVGPCENEGTSCGGFVGDEFCEDNEFCVYERDNGASTCLDNGVGICTAQPSSCDDEFDPVCGCDSQTYDNECEAHAQGVDVYTEGPCAL